MRAIVTSALRQATIVIGIALAWHGSFALNDWLFVELAHSGRANWIFLPAVLRPLAILLFGGVGAIGLVLRAYITVQGEVAVGQWHAAMLALGSGVAPWLGVALGRRLLSIPKTLSGLRGIDIFIICALCALANALLLNLYLWSVGRLNDDLLQILTVFIGDLFGAAIGLFVLSSILGLAVLRKG